MNENKLNEDLKQMSKLLFPEKKEFDKNPSRRFEDELRNQYQKLQRLKNYEFDRLESEDLVDEKFISIADYIKDHVKAVGKEQAVKDLPSFAVEVDRNVQNGFTEMKLIECIVMIGK